jgi:hypothetical protein
VQKQRFRAGLGLLVGLLAWTAHALADTPARVVLFDRPDSDELGLELSARVRGELRAAGFEVVVLALPNQMEPEEAAERVARDLEPAAVLVLRKSREPATDSAVVELWLSDRRPGSTQRERVELPATEPSAGVARLAVQVAELVKARLAELSVLPPEPREVRPAKPEPPEPRAERIDPGDNVAPVEHDDSATPSEARWILGVDVGALADLSARDTALLPLLRAGVVFRSPVVPFGVELRATLGAFGGGVSIADGPVRAELEQGLGTLELGLRFATGVPVEPAIFLGGGAYTLRARGIAPEGYATSSERMWSALGSAGAGFAYTPVRWLRWHVDAQLIAATTATVVLAEREQPERGPWFGLVSSGLAGVF